MRLRSFRFIRFHFTSRLTQQGHDIPSATSLTRQILARRNKSLTAIVECYCEGCVSVSNCGMKVFPCDIHREALS
ncbi:hypothetical protein AG1IA_08415 [Rhizoctonia solani AG-1 IA]|uniref:Uncharacterized protein n=1 Tax=Thanatephorus cucumeris (strain AG1-IA) TaxID=983506 RepID=L8WH65_THACA|nr:hypothetical protein AG1IA_08415 [Rhizoctonia solani AG-1 IA]